MVPPGKVVDFSYQWTCPHPYGEPCPWCFGGDVDEIVRSLSCARGQTYYANVKAFLAIKGEEIAITASCAESLTLPDLFNLAILYVPRHRMGVVVGWLEESGILAIGTWDRIKQSGFKPTQWGRSQLWL